MLLLIEVVDKLFLFYMLMLFGRILLSWLPEFQDKPIVRFIAHYTDPYLNLFRRIVPPIGMFDFSPIIAIFALQLIEIAIKALLGSFIRW